jgi:hypothetical protein
VNKKEIQETLKVLKMADSDCPYEWGVGNQGNKGGKLCDEHNTCEDCWRSELSAELKRLEG